MLKDKSGQLVAVEWEDTLKIAAKALNEANGKVTIGIPALIFLHGDSIFVYFRRSLE